MKTLTLTSFCCAFFVAGAAGAQTINIDFGSLAGTPPATYGGAGPAGHWNTIDVVDAAPRALFDADGERTGATIMSQFGLRSFTRDDTGTTGEDAALFDDFLHGAGDVVVGFEIEGLTPGEYRVVAYAWLPPYEFTPENLTCVWVLDNQAGTTGLNCTRGPWPGGLQEGVTHLTGIVSTSNGRLVVEYVGSFAGSSGALNGIQFIASGGLSACVCDGDGASDVFDLLGYLNGWFAGDADVNGDGATDVFDLLEWLDCFFAGCE